MSTADQTMVDHLHAAKRHLLLAYTAASVEHRDQVGALLNLMNDCEQLVADLPPAEPRIIRAVVPPADEQPRRLPTQWLEHVSFTGEKGERA